MDGEFGDHSTRMIRLPFGAEIEMACDYTAGAEQSAQVAPELPQSHYDEAFSPTNMPSLTHEEGRTESFNQSMGQSAQEDLRRSGLWASHLVRRTSLSTRSDDSDTTKAWDPNEPSEVAFREQNPPNLRAVKSQCDAALQAPSRPDSETTLRPTTMIQTVAAPVSHQTVSPAREDPILPAENETTVRRPMFITSQISKPKDKGSSFLQRSTETTTVQPSLSTGSARTEGSSRAPPFELRFAPSLGERLRSSDTAATSSSAKQSQPAELPATKDEALGQTGAERNESRQLNGKAKRGRPKGVKNGQGRTGHAAAARRLEATQESGARHDQGLAGNKEEPEPKRQRALPHPVDKVSNAAQIRKESADVNASSEEAKVAIEKPWQTPLAKAALGYSDNVQDLLRNNPTHRLQRLLHQYEDRPAPPSQPWMPSNGIQSRYRDLRR
ncbi:Hypothetical predicted protein [Lecanosticta acicola]|uniref:Uncharacterized protein n=1 Tax=Lecanosticta acicola TaxID=111012 RepID=A0AAI8YUZ3_9PEZI|nr:Hypothetical predicted protein [Lecanosticta acicola]